MQRTNTFSKYYVCIIYKYNKIFPVCFHLHVRRILLTFCNGRYNNEMYLITLAATCSSFQDVKLNASSRAQYENYILRVMYVTPSLFRYWVVPEVIADFAYRCLWPYFWMASINVMIFSFWNLSSVTLSLLYKQITRNFVYNC